MPDHALLSEAQIGEALKSLPGWERRDNRLHREYRFADFLRAWDFVSACALVAHARNHHPTWSNTYSRVEIDLWTHDAGGITDLDLEMAREFETLARPRLTAEGQA